MIGLRVRITAAADSAVVAVMDEIVTSDRPRTDLRVRRSESGDGTDLREKKEVFTPHYIENILARDSEKTASDSHLPLNLAMRSSQIQKQMSSYEKILPEKVQRRKKMRTTFTGRQIFELEKTFETKKYLNANERSVLSRYLKRD